MKSILKAAARYRGLWISVLLLWQGIALADLQVFPTRVTLTDKRRVANISLRHQGKKSGTYRISAVFYRMKPDGALEQVATPTADEKPLVKMLRFSPRVITLEPNVEQVVKVMFTGGGNLADGEYRAHLHFEPSDENEDNQTVGAGSGGKINMQLQAKVAVAIPVVFKHGQISFTVALSNLRIGRLPTNEVGFSVVMTSSGTAFPYGDFFAFFYPKSGTPQPIGVIHGVASYIPQRVVQYPLTVPPGLTLAKGTFHLEYRAPEDPDSKDKEAKVLASAEVPVP